MQNKRIEKKIEILKIRAKLFQKKRKKNELFFTFETDERVRETFKDVFIKFILYRCNTYTYTHACKYTLK